MAHDKTILELEQVASRLRRHVLSIAAAQRSHLGGSMSAADLMSALFFRFLRFEDDGRAHDRFVQRTRRESNFGLERYPLGPLSHHTDSATFWSMSSRSSVFMVGPSGKLDYYYGKPTLYQLQC